VKEIHCPECGSPYYIVPYHFMDGEKRDLFCRECGDVWEFVDRSPDPIKPMLNVLMIETFG
jgi:hypothetical protein